MITTLVALTLLLLTAAVVALFAMMGELVARVEAGQATGGPSPMGDWAMDEPDFVLGLEPRWWPQELEPSRRQPHGLVVVLSSACESCAHFLSGDLDVLDGYHPAYVLSCPSKDRADAFLRSHPVLRDRPVYVDVMGEWAREQLLVDTSPSAVLLDAGRPLAKYTMSAPTPLLEKIQITVSNKEEVA